MIGGLMIDHWKEIETVLDKYHVREDDKAAALEAYKAVCWSWCDDAAKAGGHGPDWQRENWPDEWSVATL